MNSPPEGNAKQPEPEQGASKAKNDETQTLISALIEVHQANNKASEANEKRREQHEKRQLLLEIGGLIGLAVYCLFTIMEWNVFNSERKTMEDERMDNERAWISLDKPALVLPYSPEHIGIHADVNNTGKTPGFIESIDVVVGTAYPTSTNINVIYGDHQTDLKISPPNSSLAIQLNRPLPLGENRFAMLTNRQLRVCFSIKIRYRDIFKEIRHTETCFVIEGPEKEIRTPIPTLGNDRMD